MGDHDLNWSRCGITPAHCQPDICADYNVMRDSVSNISSRAERNAHELAHHGLHLINGNNDVIDSGIRSAAFDNGARVPITTLSSRQLTEYLDAWSKLIHSGMDSKFRDLAADHGVPRFHCP